MTLKIGITGGIGSGKSTICNFFRILNIPIFEADIVAKNLYNTNSFIKSGLISLFGDDIYNKNGTVNRPKLASIIFNNDIYLSQINALVHPVVKAEFNRWVEKHKNSPYVIHEAAILFENNFYKIMDYNILVTAPTKQRIRRVMERDNIAKDKVIERINSQWDDKKKIKLASICINNDNKNLIIPKLLQIDKNVREYGKIL